jgi:hypothetical protein
MAAKGASVLLDALDLRMIQSKKLSRHTTDATRQILLIQASNFMTTWK